MEYSLEELDKMTEDLLEQYNNNELYYINMDNRSLFQLLQYIYGRCNNWVEDKKKFQDMYDYLTQTQIYRKYTDEDVAYLVDKLLIARDAHLVTGFLSVVCSWNTLGKKVLDYMYEKGYYEEMVQITDPLIFNYPSEKDSYAKKLSNRFRIYEPPDDRYVLKQTVFMLANGNLDHYLTSYLKVLFFNEKYDNFYLLFFFRDRLLNDEEKKSFDENFLEIFQYEKVHTIKQAIIGIKEERYEAITLMLKKGDFDLLNNFGIDRIPIVDEEMVSYCYNEKSYSEVRKSSLKGKKGYPNFIEDVLNGGDLGYISESVLFTPFYGYYNFKKKTFYCNGNNIIEILFKHKKHDLICNLVKRVHQPHNLVTVFNLYKRYNVLVPYNLMMKKVVFDVQYCLTDDFINELAYDYEQSSVYVGPVFIRALSLIDVTTLEIFRKQLQVCSKSDKSGIVGRMFTVLFNRTPRLKTINNCVNKKINSELTFAQIKSRYKNYYDDNYASGIVLEEQYESLLNKLRELFMKDHGSDKKYVEYLINSYRYVLSDQANKELIPMFVAEIETLINLKKRKNIYICSCTLVNDQSFYSDNDNNVYINSADIRSKTNIIIHEFVHLLHYNNCKGKTPEDFYARVKSLLADKNFMKRVKKFVKMYSLMNKKSEDVIDKLFDDKETDYEHHSFDKKTLIEYMIKSSLTENEIKTLLDNSSLYNILSGHILAQRKKKIMKKELEIVANKVDTGIYGCIGDIIDAILSGAFYTDGIKYGLFNGKKLNIGHGKSYYSNNSNKFVEIIAQYGCILKSKEQNSGKKPTPLDVLKYLVGEDFVKMLDDFYKENIANYSETKENVKAR